MLSSEGGSFGTLWWPNHDHLAQSKWSKSERESTEGGSRRTEGDSDKVGMRAAERTVRGWREKKARKWWESCSPTRGTVWESEVVDCLWRQANRNLCSTDFFFFFLSKGEIPSHLSNLIRVCSRFKCSFKAFSFFRLREKADLLKHHLTWINCNSV